MLPALHLRPFPGYECRKCVTTQRSSFPLRGGKDDPLPVRKLHCSSIKFHDFPYFNCRIVWKIGTFFGDLDSFFKGVGFHNEITTHHFFTFCKWSIGNNMFSAFEMFSSRHQCFTT